MRSVIQRPFSQICSARNALASMSLGLSCTIASSRLDVLPAALGVVGRGVIGGERLDPSPLARRDAWPCVSTAFVDELLRPLVVVHVGHRHAPVGHRAIGVERRDLAERSLGLEVPEAVQLPDALDRRTPGPRRFRGDGKVDLRHPPIR